MILSLKYLTRWDTTILFTQELARKHPGLVDMVKVHSLVDHYGLALVRNIELPIFWDPKVNDTLETMIERLLVLRDYVDFISIHASAGERALEACVRCLEGYRAQLVAITVLTSLSDADIHEETNGGFHSAAELALVRARRAMRAGIRHIVCGVPDLPQIRSDPAFTHAVFITPGIREARDAIPDDDQQRTGTLRKARDNGAAYGVLGRTVTNARDPIQRLYAIRETLN